MRTFETKITTLVLEFRKFFQEPARETFGKVLHYSAGVPFPKGVLLSYPEHPLGIPAQSFPPNLFLYTSIPTIYYLYIYIYIYIYI
jgi:hypothetical protein